jgi:hypothetical protein
MEMHRMDRGGESNPDEVNGGYRHSHSNRPRLAPRRQLYFGRNDISTCMLYDAARLAFATADLVAYLLRHLVWQLANRTLAQPPHGTPSWLNCLIL